MENQSIGSVNFDQLVGLEAALYYNNHSNQFQLGDVLFEVIEDEEDGYRSSMREVAVINTNAERKPGDFLGFVKIQSENEGNFDGYHLIDTDNSHIWLQFGTDNNDDYYPTFVFNFQPKLPKIIQP
jgi:hypothetical protein